MMMDASATPNNRASQRDTGQQFDSQTAPLHVIGLRETLALIRRHQKFILTFVAICAALLAIILSMMSNSYVATSALVLERRDTSLLDSVTDVQGDIRDRSALETEMDILTSRVLGGMVVDAMNLVHHPWFNTYLPDPSQPPETPSLIERGVAGVRSLFGFAASPAARKVPSLSVQRDRAISVLLSKVTVTRSGDSFAVSVHVATPDPELSATLANTFANVYVNWLIETKKKVATDAVAFLRERAAEITRSIGDNERKIAEFTTANGLATEARDDILRQQVDGFNTQLTAARGELAGTRARLAQAKALLEGTQDLDSSSLTSALLTSLRTDRARLTLERAQHSANFSTNHPMVLKTDAELSSLDAMLKREIARITDELQDQEAVTLNRVQDLERQITSLQTSLRRRALAEIRYRELARDLLSDQKLHDLVVARLGDLDPYAEVVKPGAKVVSVAEVPTEQSFPQRGRMFVGGVIGSAIIAVICAVAYEALDTNLRSGQRISQLVHVPNVANIPRLPRAWRNHDAPLPSWLARHPRSPYAESLRALYLACRPPAPSAKRVIMLSSASPDSNATSIALGLACMAALDGVSTVLIELDPAGHLDRRLTMGQNATLSDAVEGTSSLVEAIAILPDIPQLGLLWTRPARDLNGESFPIQSDTMRWALDDLQRNYDLIVIHAAPVLVLADANWLAPFIDAAILVIRYGNTSEQELTDAASSLRLNEVPLIGTAIVDVDPRDLPAYVAKRGKKGGGPFGLNLNRLKGRAA